MNNHHIFIPTGSSTLLLSLRCCILTCPSFRLSVKTAYCVGQINFWGHWPVHYNQCHIGWCWWVSTFFVLVILTIDYDVLIRKRVDQQLNCIKGGGACHLCKKVLAEAVNTCVCWAVSPHTSHANFIIWPNMLFNGIKWCHVSLLVCFNGHRFVVVADYQKGIESLGTNVYAAATLLYSCATDSLPPTIIVPFRHSHRGCSVHLWQCPPHIAPWAWFARRCAAYGHRQRCIMVSDFFLVLLTPVSTAGPVVLDNGNFIIDALFDPERLKPLTGIVLTDQE